MPDDDSNYHKLPIDGILDLHTFNPQEIKALIPEYISACLENNIFHLRIIHGKGIGILREIVHSILKNHPAVITYRLDPSPGSSWGVTLVDLQKTPIN
jgi:DNA-nicking Smr family endonuclease